MIYLHLKAASDNNGNPRRLFMVLDANGNIQAVIDQGYNGSREVDKRFPDAKEGPMISITVSEYNPLLNWSKKAKVM